MAKRKAVKTPARACLSGGRAEREHVEASDFPAELVADGTKHEMEHTHSEVVARQIALDHLAEDPEYYFKLKTIEKSKSVRPHYRKNKRVQGYNTPKDFVGLDSQHIYEMAKSAMAAGELDLYKSFRYELERRAFVDRATKSLGEVAGHSAGYAADPGAASPADVSPESRRRPAERDRKIFNDMHGVSESDESESISKAELINELRGIIAEEIGSQLEKAILTKQAGAREKPVKTAKPNSKAKVGVNSKGKTYQYDQKNKTGAAPTPGQPGLPGMMEDPGPKDIEPEPEAKLNPNKLAVLLGTTVADLESLAGSKSEREFVVYFETHAAQVIKQYEIPTDYWVELYNTLKQSLKSKTVDKSISSSDQFDLNISVYSNGSEMYNVVAGLSGAGVSNLSNLEDFLVNNYDIAKSAAQEEASNILKAMISDGAIVMK